MDFDLATGLQRPEQCTHEQSYEVHLVWRLVGRVANNDMRFGLSGGFAVVAIESAFHGVAAGFAHPVSAHIRRSLAVGRSAVFQNFFCGLSKCMRVQCLTMYFAKIQNILNGHTRLESTFMKEIL